MTNKELSKRSLKKLLKGRRVLYTLYQEPELEALWLLGCRDGIYWKRAMSVQC
jgi:hypothetical protein